MKNKTITLAAATQMATEAKQLAAKAALLRQARASAITEFEAQLEKQYGHLKQARDLEVRVASLSEQIEMWAESERGNLAGKSTVLAGVKLGWRKGPPKLCLRKGQQWEDVIGTLVTWTTSKLASLRELSTRFLSMHPTLDKREMIEARDDEGVSDAFRSLGVKVEQEETFYLDLEA